MKKAAVLLGFISSFLVLGSCGGTTNSSLTSSESSDIDSSSVSGGEINIAEVYETTGSRSKLFSRADDIELVPYAYQGHSEVYVSSESLAPFYGHGGALTHSSAYLLSNLADDDRHEILELLYGESGAHLSIVRIPWGTSDYTVPDEDFYTFDDVEGSKDYTLEYFSIEKDERYLIPVLKEIIEINPDVIVMAAPWSAPAWMKTSNSLIGGSLVGQENTELNNPSPEEIAYANYLFKAVEAYEASGVPIDYVSIVNEPLVSVVQYPYMRMESAQMYRVAERFASLLNESSYDTKIMAYDHNVGQGLDLTFDGYASLLSSNDGLDGALGAFAVHCYDGNWPNVYGDFIYNYRETPAYGNYPVFITEVTESATSVDFAQNLSWAADNVAIGPVGQGYSGAVYWNLVLDENGQPVKGNNSTCYGLVTLNDDGSYSLSSSYYAMLHLSRFSHLKNGIAPEWVSSESTNFGTIVTAALKNQDGSIAVALVNTSDRVEETVDVVFNEMMASITIKPQSVTTLLLKEGTGEYFESLELESVNIQQIAYGEYDIAFTLMNDEEDVSFYLSEGEAKEEGLLSLTYEDGVYKGRTSLKPGEWGLLMKKDAVEGQLSLTIPRLNPQIRLLEGDEYYVEARFGLDTGMSWSSFCDPYGKEVYRSSSPVFDESAEKANVLADGSDDQIYITTDEYVDRGSSSEKSYYYFRLVGKDGLVTYTTSAVTFRESIYGVNDDTLRLSLENGTPSLIYEGTAVSDLGKNSILYLKDINGEEHSSPIASVDENNHLTIAFDLTLLEKRGVWYDLFIVDGGGASSFEFTVDNCPEYETTVEHEGTQYKFENWEGVIKINCIAL